MFRLALIFLIPSAFALEKDDVVKRFQLVGVVGESNHKGIVVLRDVESKRSLRLRLGQLLPTQSTWMLTSITANSITLQNKSEKAYITYAPQAEEKLSEDTENSEEGSDFFLLGGEDESSFIEKLEQLTKPRHDSARNSDIEKVDAVSEPESETLGEL